ncbi:hypothetical protein EBT16_13435, partial [bacterium]|nr:hypothetical protein [bacterium]
GDKEFQDTVKLLENSHWTKLHVFSFSARRGTVAAGLSPVVPETVIAERSLRLREMSEKRHLNFLKSQLGKEKAVVFEKLTKGSKDVWQGHTENYIPTLTFSNDAEPKRVETLKLVKVEGEKVWTASSLGEVTVH